MKCNYTKIYLSKDLEDAKWERIKMENEYREMKRKMKIIEEEKEKRESMEDNEAPTRSQNSK